MVINYFSSCFLYKWCLFWLYFLENIIVTILTNMSLGMPQPLKTCSKWFEWSKFHFSSFSMFKHFLTSIDDFYRCTWIYLLKIKSQNFDMFLAYKVLVEKQFRHQLYKLRKIMLVNMLIKKLQLSTLHSEIKF